jgi:cytochrome c
MKPSVIGVLVASLMVAGSAMAVDIPAEGGSCKACHKMDGKQVGPGFKQIAEKYKGDADAANKLVANITKGGDFGWKMGKMPPKGMAKSDADIKKMVEFITGLN